MNANKLSSLILLLIGLLFTTYTTTAQFVTLIEESTSGKYRNVISEESAGIVDINSVIKIKIDVPVLENTMFQFQGVASTNPRLLKLQELNRLLRYQNLIVEMIQSKFSDGNANATFADYKKFSAILDALLEEIADDDDMLDLVDNPTVETRFNSYRGTYPYALVVLDVLSEEAEAVRNSLSNELGLNGKVDSSLVINFRLGAFIRNKQGGRPIHVENFDRISQDQYLEISRFDKPLSQDEKDAILVNKQISDSLQINTTRAIGQFKNLVTAKVNNLFPSDSSRIKLTNTFGQTLVRLNENIDTRPAANVLLKHELNLNRVGQTYTAIKEIYEEFSRKFPNGLLSEGNLDRSFQELGELIITGYNAFNRDITDFQTNSSSALGLTDLRNVDNLYQDYVQSAQNDINNIQKILDGVKGLLDPFRKSYLENEAFSNKVLRFTAGNIPPEGLIELKLIGERRAGDEILIKAVIERGRNRNNPNFESRDIYRRVLTMTRVSPYFKMSGSLVLANPFNDAGNDKVTLSSDFQFAPTYGIFMKWGSRKSKFYNDFLSFGLGLGFSSPDFNTDGTPEFGSSIMITAFRDILSTGVGWNFGADAPYTFIGFNIPFSIGGLPSTPNTIGSSGPF